MTDTAQSEQGKAHADSRVPLSQASTHDCSQAPSVARGRAHGYMKRVPTAGHLGLKNHSNVFPWKTSFPHRMVKDAERGYLLGLPDQAAKPQTDAQQTDWSPASNNLRKSSQCSNL